MMEDRTLKTSELVQKHGAVAAIALASRHLRLSEVEELISDAEELDDQLIDRIVEAERKALTRQIW
jgi:hypothetical protein